MPTTTPTATEIAATPASNLIENPDPQAGSNNFYTNDSPAPGDLGNTSTGGFVNCSDTSQAGCGGDQ